ncbi:MAG: serine hydrolase [Clostridia bacterium]|nr:serine hydrolase [Clostridia bacterium]
MAVIHLPSLFKNTEEFIKEHIKNGKADDVMLSVGTLDGQSYRFFHSKRGDVLNEKTLCDMMSVTKILATTPLCLMAIDEGLLRLDDTLGKFFPYAPEDKRDITVLQMLTHQSGMSHCFVKPTFGPFDKDEAAQFQLNRPLAAKPGERFIYCCNNMILLAFVLEKLYRKPLDLLFCERIAYPLDMRRTRYLCRDAENSILCTLTPWTGENMCCDPSARRLGGVAGHAGIFSCLEDMEKFALSLLCGHAPLVSERTFALARKNHTAHLSESRGIGYVYVDSRYAQTGRLFSEGSLGHCGHSGTSVFVDNEKGMYVVALSNTTRLAEEKKLGYGPTMQFRADLHNAIADDLGI